MLPPLTLVLLFRAADYKKLIPLSVLCFLAVLYGVAFGWYGAFTYAIFKLVTTGDSVYYAAPEVQGAGIFISWASSLPILYLLNRELDRLRQASMLDRLFSMTIIFYGSHLVAALCLSIIMP